MARKSPKISGSSQATGFIVPEWVGDVSIRLRLEAIIKDPNNTSRQTVVNIISAANSAIKDIGQDKKKVKKAKVKARTSLTAIIAASKIHVGDMDTVERVAALKAVKRFRDFQKANAVQSPTPAISQEPVVEEPVYAQVASLNPSDQIRDLTPAGTELPETRLARGGNAKSIRPRSRLLTLTMASVLLILATLYPRRRTQRVSIMPHDAETITDATHLDNTPDIPTTPAPVPVFDNVTQVEQPETPVEYSWQFPRPKPPGYQNACIQGAVMSVLIADFDMSMDDLYTNAVAHRAEVALKTARGAAIHTQEDTDFIATSYHPDRGVIVVAQMRIGNAQPLGITIVNLNPQSGTDTLAGFDLEKAKISVSSAWLRHSH